VEQRKKIKGQLFHYLRPHLEVLDMSGEPRANAGTLLWNPLGKILYNQIESKLANHLETIRITSDIVNKIDTQ